MIYGKIHMCLGWSLQVFVSKIHEICFRSVLPQNTIHLISELVFLFIEMV